MLNGQKSPCRTRSGRKGRRTIGTVILTLLSLARVDSTHWIEAAEPVWTGYTTPIGNTATVTLQDGSSVALNTDTRIKVAYSGRQRRVVLEHGEALFDVVTHPDWPFSITVGVATVRSVGTKLSVRLREDDKIEVLVIDGRAGIEGDNSSLVRVGYTPHGALFSTSAVAGELISMNSTTVLNRTELTPSALKRRTAWTDGWLWFVKEPLPEALAEFNRYHRERLVLVDPALARLEIGGRFRASDLESFLAALEHSFNVRRIPATVYAPDLSTIHLTGRCGRAQQQCNWPLVQ